MIELKYDQTLVVNKPQYDFARTLKGMFCCRTRSLGPAQRVYEIKCWSTFGCKKAIEDKLNKLA